MPLGVKYGRYPPSHRTKSKKIEHFVSVPGGAVDRCHHHPLPNRRLVLHRLLRGRRLGDRRVACRADIFPYLNASARQVAIYLATYRGVATSCCPCNLPPLSAGGVWRSAAHVSRIGAFGIERVGVGTFQSRTSMRRLVPISRVIGSNRNPINQAGSSKAA